MFGVFSLQYASAGESPQRHREHERGTVDFVNMVRRVGMGLDEKAAEAVGRWRFKPAMKDGHPVACQVMVKVNFRLY